MRARRKVMLDTTLTRLAGEALHMLSRRPLSKSVPAPSALQRAGVEEGVAVRVGVTVGVFVWELELVLVCERVWDELGVPV